jgi:hypothetical protein
MRTKLVIATVVTAAAVSAVGASAYTASITGGDPTKVIGYTTTAISGASMVTPPVLHYSAGLDKISTIDVVLTGDTSTSTLSVNRNAAAPVTCAPGVHTTNTAYTCTVNFDIDGMDTIGYALQ